MALDGMVKVTTRLADCADGQRHDLWRALDQDGDVIDISVQ